MCVVCVVISLVLIDNADIPEMQLVVPKTFETTDATTTHIQSGITISRPDPLPGQQRQGPSRKKEDQLISAQGNLT